MNTIKAKINWNDRKEKLKQKFIFLMDNDLMFEEDTKDKMLEKLQKELGMTKDELNKIIAAF
jgi:uncharacterized protein YjbJ (UPF0337 family)